MEIVKIDINGDISGRILNKYGGDFSFIEKIKLKGVGSPKLIYESGILEFDKIKSDYGNNVMFINFQLLKESILIRVNKNQQLLGLLAKYDEITDVFLLAKRYKFKFRLNEVGFKIVEMGELNLQFNNGKNLFLIVNFPDFKQTINYFLNIKILENKFRFASSCEPPICEKGDALFEKLKPILNFKNNP